MTEVPAATEPQSNQLPVVEGIVPSDEISQDPDFFEGLDDDDEE